MTVAVATGYEQQSARASRVSERIDHRTPTCVSDPVGQRTLSRYPQRNPEQTPRRGVGTVRWERDTSLGMGVPLTIASLTFAGAGALAARWLPALASNRVGALAFVTVCVLLGVTSAIIGIHVYEIIRELDAIGGGQIGGSINKPNILAAGLAELLQDAGPVLGLAVAVYLLAPSADDSVSHR
jgi:hypothetical protein